MNARSYLNQILILGSVCKIVGQLRHGHVQFSFPYVDIGLVYLLHLEDHLADAFLDVFQYTHRLVGSLGILLAIQLFGGYVNLNLLDDFLIAVNKTG